jgi:hypothetical protein
VPALAEFLLAVQECLNDFAAHERFQWQGRGHVAAEAETSNVDEQV